MVIVVVVGFDALVFSCIVFKAAMPYVCAYMCVFLVDDVIVLYFCWIART